MKRRNFNVTVVTVALGAWISVGAAFQATPDLSGQWTIEAAPATPPAGTAAPPGRPDQGTLSRGDMGSGWGSPLTITQDAKQLVVVQALFSRYDAMTPLRFVYALDGSESRNDVMIGHSAQLRLSRAAWEGQTLRITTRYPGIDPDTGKPFSIEVIHRLSLESPTGLIVEVTRGAAIGGQPTTTRSVYRKG